MASKFFELGVCPQITNSWPWLTRNFPPARRSAGRAHSGCLAVLQSNPQTHRLYIFRSVGSEKSTKGHTMSHKKVSGAIVLMVAVAGFSWVHAESSKVPKLTADDYIEIQQLYSAYAHSLDQGQAERFAATFIEGGEFTGGRGAGKADDPRVPTKGKDALMNMGSRGGTRHFTASSLRRPLRAPKARVISCCSTRETFRRPSLKPRSTMTRW